jgi:diaminohydroxyphosphoribosylaminopyrimidine deaminase/5-amino-6-(5-phosphoribosylamino)uracil reductase
LNDIRSDERFMARALELARAGVGLASPNPHVGAVVVAPASGEVAGSGTHTYAGLKHAEVLALEQAGARARGATLYLNLEPCCHQGRTGPCTEAVIAAGIERVVASMADPNPRVAGRGFERLRAAGIEVSVGLGQAEAGKLNEAFANYIRKQRPLVTLKSAMTLDAKIAGCNHQEKGHPGGELHGGGSVTWITGEAARAHVHRLRHASDAILVGAGTVLADNPWLTDRSGMPRRRPLLRVVLDSQLRLPLNSRIVSSAASDVLVFCTSSDVEKQQALRAAGVCVEQVPAGPGGRAAFAEVVARLGAREITSLLIEGGAEINGAALAAGVVDKVFLYYAPRLLGDGGLPFVSGFSGEVILQNVSVHRFGEDFAAEGYVRDPYA